MKSEKVPLMPVRDVTSLTKGAALLEAGAIAPTRRERTAIMRQVSTTVACLVDVRLLVMGKGWAATQSSCESARSFRSSCCLTSFSASEDFSLMMDSFQPHWQRKLGELIRETDLCGLKF